MAFNDAYLNVIDQNLLEAIGQHVLGLLGATVTNFGHTELTLELPADSVVDTLGLSPVGL